MVYVKLKVPFFSFSCSLAILELVAEDFGQWGCNLILNNGQRITKEKENTMIISNETESIDLVNPVNPLTSEDSSNDGTKNEVGPTENISKEAGKTNMLNNDKRFHVKNFESKISKDDMIENKERFENFNEKNFKSHDNTTVDEIEQNETQSNQIISSNHFMMNQTCTFRRHRSIYVIIDLDVKIDINSIFALSMCDKLNCSIYF